MRREAQTDKIDALKLAYYEQLALGVYGNTATIIDGDMRRAGIQSPVGLSMLWDAEICERAREVEVQSGTKPRLGIAMSAWQTALGQMIEELRNAVAAQTPDAAAGIGDDGSTGGTPSPSSPVLSERCPTCAEPVASIFDHVDLDCEHA